MANRNEIVYNRDNSWVRLLVVLCSIPCFIIFADYQVYLVSSIVVFGISAAFIKRIIVINGFAREVGRYTSLFGIRLGESQSFSNYEWIAVKKVKVSEDEITQMPEFEYTLSINNFDEGEVVLQRFKQGLPALQAVLKLEKATAKRILNTTTYVNLQVLDDIRKTSDSELAIIIGSHMSYFKKLTDTGKKKFLARVKQFVEERRFDFRDDLKADKIPVILIASCAVQLTFGLKYFALNFFNRILIYPTVFSSLSRSAKLKGGTFPVGFVALSYKHFIDGYENDTDKINLGLHEMTHALKIDLLKPGYAPKFDRLLAQFLKVGKSEYLNMKQGKKSFLRAYGGTNVDEFFAVSVEHFFEAPDEFNKCLPQMYRAMCGLLNQNPINKEKDYRLD